MKFNVQSKDIFNSTVIIILFLGIVPLLNAGYDHDVVFLLIFITLPILLVISLKNKKDQNLEINSPNFLVALILLWSFLSIFWSINHVRSIIEWFQLFSAVLIFLLIQNINEENIEKVVKIILITGLGIASFGILEYIFVAGRRIVSTFPNPNPLGIYLTMLFLFTLNLSLRSFETNKKITKYDYFSIIFLIALILTGSRGSYISLIIAFPVIFINLSKNNIIKNIIKSIIVVAISIILANIIMILASYVQNVIFSRTLFESMTRVESFVPSSLKGRLEFWKVAVNLFKYRPLHGFGIGSFFSAYYIEYSGNEWYSRFAHNHYLQTVVEQGFVGLFILLGFIFLSFKNIFCSFKLKVTNKYTAGAIGAVVAFLIHIGADFSWNFPAVLILLFAFLGIALNNHDTNYNKNMTKKSIKISYKLISLILLLVLIFSVWHFISNKILEKGLVEIEDNPEKALEYFEIGNKIYPINSMGFYLESSIYLSKYNESENDDFLDKALELSKKSVDLAPYDSQVLNNLGKVYWKKEELEKAEKYLIKASEYGAYILSVHKDLGEFYISNNELEKAEEVLLNSIDYIDYSVKRAPKDQKPIKKIEGAIIYNYLSRIYEEWNQTDKASFYKSREEDLIKEAFSIIN